MSLSTTQYNMFFSIYYLPNIVMPLFTGYLADIFGRKVGLLFCSTMIVIGHSLFASGVSGCSFVASLIGRLSFGLGAESYQAIALECLTFWNYEFISLSMAVQSIAKGLGTTINNYGMPHLYAITGNLPFGFWIGFCFAVLCLLSSIAFGCVESCAVAKRTQQSNKRVNFSEIFNFPSLFWILTFQGCLFEANSSSFNAIASGMAQARFGFNVKEAGVLIVTFLCPRLVRSNGHEHRRQSLLRTNHRPLQTQLYVLYIPANRVALIASALQLTVFITFVLIPDSVPKWVVYAVFGLYGVSLSIFITSYWPCIKFTVPSGLTTTAYGLNFCLQAILMVLGPLLIGHVIDTTKAYSGGYYWAAQVFVMAALLTLIVSVVVLVRSCKREAVLYQQVSQIDETDDS